MRCSPALYDGGFPGGKFQGDAADLQKLIDDSGRHFQLRPWDWNDYAGKLWAKRFDFDEFQVKPMPDALKEKLLASVDFN